MLENIDNFINKFLNWNVLKYIILSELSLIPYLLITNKYGVHGFELFVMGLSFGASVNYCVKAFKNFFE